MYVMSFCGEADRTFSAAHSVEYVKGCRHPDRIMREHDFFYVIAGNQKVVQEGEYYLVEPGDVCILPAGLHHRGRGLCADGSRTMYLHVGADARDTNDGGTGEPRIPLPTVIHCGKHPEVRKTFEAIVRAFSLGDAYRTLRLNTLFRTLLLALYDARRDVEAGEENLTEAMLRLFDDDPRHFYSYVELAEKFHVSRRVLAECFKAEIGVPLHRYQLDHKLGAVRSMLEAHPDIKLREMAVNFGFYDEFHLSRAFKRAFGVSPLGYRARIAAQQEEENPTAKNPPDED